LSNGIRPINTSVTLFLFLLVCWYISSFEKQIASGTKQSGSSRGFIKNTDPRTSIKQTELSRILNVENRVKQLRLNHVYKIFSDAFPSYLKINL